jgi:hypothetical protein
MADWQNTVATVAFEKAVEFQLNELSPGYETMCDFKGGVVGEKVQITDRFSDLPYDEIEDRLGDTDLPETDVERRWIHIPNRLRTGTFLDRDDQHATEIPLDSPLAIGVARAIGIARRDQFLVGFHGNAYVGKEGTTAVPFKAANVFAADYGETLTQYKGLTENKLIGLRKKARQLLIDPQDPTNRLHMGITAEEIEDLLKIDHYVSRDFNPDSQVRKPLSAGAKQALQDGEPTDFLGIHFVPMEFTNTKAYPKAAALGLNGSGHRRCPVWIPKGISGRQWLGIETHRDIRPDKNHATQFTAYSKLRYSRNNEDLAFIVECAD